MRPLVHLGQYSTVFHHTLTESSSPGFQRRTIPALSRDNRHLTSCMQKQCSTTELYNKKPWFAKPNHDLLYGQTHSSFHMCKLFNEHAWREVLLHGTSICMTGKALYQLINHGLEETTKPGNSGLLRTRRPKVQLLLHFNKRLHSGDRSQPVKLSAEQDGNRSRQTTLNYGLPVVCLGAQTMLWVLSYGDHKTWFHATSELK